MTRSTGIQYRSLWHEEDERNARLTTIKRDRPAHSTGEEYIPPYAPVSARQHANSARILPDPAAGVETPMVGVPVGMPI